MNQPQTTHNNALDQSGHHTYRHKDTQSTAPTDCRNALLYIPICGLLFLATVEYVLLTKAALFITIAAICVAIPWLVTLYGWMLNGTDWIASRLLYRQRPNDIIFTDDSLLPRITILLPVHDEANMLPQICNMLQTLDYPADRLDCMVLIEADDQSTMAAALAFEWPAFCRLMSMPKYGPTTKARACNYALHRAHGDILVIFDAEDRPHPNQLREAAARFVAADARLACLQAPLEIRPQSANWREHQFALEYSVLFRMILRGLGRACAALPLGGSSIFFRIALLRELGGWDDYNLTEDADLGVRLARAGYKTQTLTHPTLENAPHTHLIWHRQRTRWHSGHIQTLHMHGLPPLDNARSFIGWLVCMMMLIARLLSGPLHASAFAIAFISPQYRFETLSNSNLSLMVAAFYGAWLVLLYAHTPARLGWKRVFLTLTHPFYWLLTVLPLINACKRMALGQLAWLKSTHLPYEAPLEGDEKTHQL